MWRHCEGKSGCQLYVFAVTLAQHLSTTQDENLARKLVRSMGLWG